MFMGLMVPHDAYPTSMFEGRSTKFDTARKITEYEYEYECKCKSKCVFGYDSQRPGTEL